MKNQFVLANGSTLVIPVSTVEHLVAHPDVTEELLEIGASCITPPDSQTVSQVDLFDQFGNWGTSGLVPVERATLFAFRKGRVAPSSVIDSSGVPASYLSMVTKPSETLGEYILITAFCSEGVGAKPEPITPMVDPRTEAGKKLRAEFLDFWQTHALALGCTPIEGEPFESIWNEIIAKYGSVYHQ